METLIIALMLILVFRKEILEKLNSEAPILLRNAEPFTRYLGASAVLSTLFALWPSYLMIVYMRTEGFYAFELFSSESRAFGVLAGNIMFNFFFMALMFFGAIILSAAKAQRSTIWTVGFFNVLLIGYFLMLAYVSSAWVIFGGILVVTAATTGYSIWVARSGTAGKAKRWFIPLLVAAAMYFLPAWLPDYTAEIVSSSLAQMKVGGICVQVSEPGDYLKAKTLDTKVAETPFKGWLLLRTPEGLYLRASRGPGAVTVLKADGFAVLPVDNLQCAGK